MQSQYILCSKVSLVILHVHAGKHDGMLDAEKLRERGCNGRHLCYCCDACLVRENSKSDLNTSDYRGETFSSSAMCHLADTDSAQGPST